MVAVLISTMLSPFIPRVSLPLVQVALGIAWYFTPFLPNVNLDSDLYMILFITPLLFHEAKESSRGSLKRTLTISLSLAVGLVLFSIGTTGVILHNLWPAIPLAAAFAIGAALGPTDAVAVSQMQKEAQLSDRQMSVLSTESLFNDAASIVSFQFAISALSGADFSAAHFSLSVINSFVIGAALGAALGFCLNVLMRFLRRHRLVTTTTRITIELIFPLMTYALAEHIEVSGVIAVVAAGLVLSYHRVGIGGDVARTNMVSSSVWSVVANSLNGSVFVLLGIELPLAMRSSIVSSYVSTRRLVVVVLLLTVVALLLRFLWISAMLRLTRDEKTGKRRPMTPQRWHSAAVMTFGGAKGTISLILAFSLPSSLDMNGEFPIRSALLFIAALYILISLILANIILPLLAPKTSDESGQEFAAANSIMLNRTISAISGLSTSSNHAAVATIMRSYAARIERHNGTVLTEQQQEDLRSLRVRIIEWQKDWLDTRESEYMMNNDEKRADAAQRLMVSIDSSLAHDSLKHHSPASRYAHYIYQWLRVRMHDARARFNRLPTVDDDSALIDMHVELLQATIRHLYDLMSQPDVKTTSANILINEYRSLIRGLRGTHLSAKERTEFGKQV